MREQFNRRTKKLFRGPLEMNKMVDTGWNSSENPGQELQDDWLFNVMLFQMMFENIEVANIIALEFDPDVMIQTN